MVLELTGCTFLVTCIPKLYLPETIVTV
ncbi:hypothetical protein ZEAMMB73_Zm00001d012679 [Zea mays]|nr:hypothetical protein ZEAMMB73_Zm00001d012679 [Zea mays]